MSDNPSPPIKPPEVSTSPAAPAPDTKDSQTTADAGSGGRALAGVTIPPSRPLIYSITRMCLWLFFGWLVIRAIGVGVARIPNRGGALLACNHASFFDPFITGFVIKRPLRFFARATLFLNPLFRRLIATLGAIPMERGGADFKALRTVVDRLKAGEVVVVYPEGTRTKDGELQEFKPGVAVMAEMSGSPVFPVYIHGSYESFGRGGGVRLFRKHWILFGDPLKWAEVPAEMPEREKKQWFTAELAKRMKALETEARERWPLRKYPLPKPA